MHSPRFLLTGWELSFDKHAVLVFGSYVQTHEEHSNGMEPRTMRAICLGPTGNAQGGHWFLSLTSRHCIVRHHWTALPMPQEVILHITQIDCAQGMSSCIIYANCQGDEISDCLEDFLNDDNAASYTSDNDSYVTSDSDSDDDDYSISNDKTMSSDNNNDDDPHDDHHLPSPEVLDAPGAMAPPPPPDQGVEKDPNDEEDDDNDDNGPPHTDNTAEHIPADIPLIDAAAAPPQAIDEYENDDSSNGASLDLPPTEHERFKATEEAGRAAADIKASERHATM